MSKQRYEKEIEEILAKYDQEAGRKARPISPERPREPILPTGTYSAPKRTSSLPNWRRISSGQYILAAFVVALLAVLVHNAVPVLATILVLASVALFLMPIVVHYRTGSSTGGWSASEEKRWRGEVIDFRTRRKMSEDPLAGIKRWFKRR